MQAQWAVCRSKALLDDSRLAYDPHYAVMALNRSCNRANVVKHVSRQPPLSAEPWMQSCRVSLMLVSEIPRVEYFLHPASRHVTEHASGMGRLAFVSLATRC